MLHPTLLQLAQNYVDQSILDEHINQFDQIERPIASQLISHLIISHLLLTICITLSTSDRNVLWQILQKPTGDYSQLQDWLDKHIDECRLVLADSVQKSLYAVTTIETMDAHDSN